jgi:hypothetical protein
VAAPVQRTPGRRPVPVAVATHKLRQGRWRTPAVRTPPVRHRPCGHRPRLGAAADSQGVPGVRLGQGGGGPAAAVRRGGRTAQVGFARLRWSCGQVDAACGERLSGWMDTGHSLPNTGSRHAPARRTPATAAGHGGHCGSGHAGQPAAGPSTPGNGVRPERDPNVRHRPPRPADRQIRSLGAGGWKAGVVLERERSSGKPIVKVSAGRARQNVDRIVDRAEQAGKLRAPDFDLVLSGSERSAGGRPGCAPPRVREVDTRARLRRSSPHRLHPGSSAHHQVAPPVIG